MVIRQTGGSVEERAEAIALLKRSIELNFREIKLLTEKMYLK